MNSGSPVRPNQGFNLSNQLALDGFLAECKAPDGNDDQHERRQGKQGVESEHATQPGSVEAVPSIEALDKELLQFTGIENIGASDAVELCALLLHNASRVPGYHAVDTSVCLLKELHRPLVLFGSFASGEGSQVPALPGLRIGFLGIETIPPSFQFSNHVRTLSSPAAVHR
jgi:hypothetical protein